MTMSDAQRISASRRVSAPPGAIFAIITSPQGHVDIDGSGMLVAAAPDAPAVTAVGDTFAMHMDRRPLGDIPDMGEYDVTVVITRYEPDALLEWSILTSKGRPFGHVYGYQLEPSGDGQTLVTSYYDWSGIPAHRMDPSRWPIVPLSALEESLANLARLAERG